MKHTEWEWKKKQNKRSISIRGKFQFIHIRYARKCKKNYGMEKQNTTTLLAASNSWIHSIPLMKLINSCWWWLSFSYMCILIEFDTILDKNKNNIIGQKGFVRALIVSFTGCRTANAEIRRKKNANNYEQLNCRCVCDVKGRTPLIPTDLTRSMPTDTHTQSSLSLVYVERAAKMPHQTKNCAANVQQ